MDRCANGLLNVQERNKKGIVKSLLSFLPNTTVASVFNTHCTHKMWQFLVSYILRSTNPLIPTRYLLFRGFDLDERVVQF